MLIDELLVIGDNGLRDSLSDGVDLGSMSTTGNPDSDIDVGELVETNNEEGFVDLESQDLGLDQVERLSVDLDESLTSLIPSCQFFVLAQIVFPSSSCSNNSYLAVGDGRSCSQFCQHFCCIGEQRLLLTCLLLAEALYTLGGRSHVCGVRECCRYV